MAVVEGLMKYQRAASMPSQQHFIYSLEKGMKLAPIFCQTQNILFYVLRRK
jgi:hypothetical protein